VGAPEGPQAHEPFLSVAAKITAAAIFGLGFAYLGAFHLGTIASTARDDSAVARWPTLDRWWEDILRPLLCMLFHVVLCIVIPAWILRFALPTPDVMPQDEKDYIRAVRVVALLAMGFFYLPMTAVLASMAPGVSAMNPLRVVIGVFQTVRQYVVALFLFALCLGSVYLTLYFGRETLISFPLDFPLWAASLYLSLATARALGRLYRVNREGLGWEQDSVTP
jgi:phosphotransferase system  glucose/maltose/N-acetylglucosamine-specific IIC component